ncbi:MAG: 30S ribosomal protein S6 [Candidatus Brocadiales bacterium]
MGLNTYEGMFLIDNAKASDWDNVVEHVHGILKKRDAQIISTEKWGERKLAYRLDGHRRGTYMHVYFTAPGEAISDVRRDCQLSDAVLRDLILRIEKVPEPPAETSEVEPPAETSEVKPPVQGEGSLEAVGKASEEADS